MNLLSNYLTLGNPQYEIFFTQGEDNYAQLTFDALGEALPRITATFEVNTPFPKIRAVLVSERSEFDRLVLGWLGVPIETPSNPARVAQPQRTDLVLLSPPAYATHSVYKYAPDEFRRLLGHELVHMVEEFLSPDIETSPRWWGEGLAVYLSGQWLHEDEFRKAAMDGVAKGEFPTFQQIATERKLAYAWGWTVVRFIESAWGKEMIRRIVKECADGNVFAVIGEDAATLEGRWREWLLTEGSLAPRK